MNERIKELLEQAVIAVDNPFPENPLNDELAKMYIPDCFAEKFAGLIIQECLNHCDWQTGQRIQKYFEYRDNRWAETEHNPKPF